MRIYRDCTEMLFSIGIKLVLKIAYKCRCVEQKYITKTMNLGKGYQFKPKMG